MFEAYVTATAGCILLISRFLGARSESFEPLTQWPKVSIIVPARNEERNLPVLLHSLELLDYPDYEVIVVDDQSQDQTVKVARSFAKVKVVLGSPRPEKWVGKAWACHQGAQKAEGSLLLFTDADTSHNPDGLKRAVYSLKRTNAGLLSCLPYHQNLTWWEKLTGPFHILLLAMTAPFNPPKPRRLFAIGQYLLFSREAYRTVGGHEGICSDLADDLAIARQVVQSGIVYHVFRGGPLFKVRMYESLKDFLGGWRRNFRLGFAYSHPLSGLEATLMIMALTGAGHLGSSFITSSITLTCLLFMGFIQQRLGRFSPWGIILWPFSLILFCSSAALALMDLLLKKNIPWKDRLYAPPTKHA